MTSSSAVPMTPSAASASSPSPAIVAVEGLTIGWDDVVLQKDLNFEIARGDVFGILGGSGCGKSTLLRHMIGLEAPKAGRVLIHGEPQTGVEVGRPRYGVMFQAGALFGSLTVGENVALPIERWTDIPHDAVDAIAEAKLRLVGLEGAARKLPSELSGGMRKRAAIARAMALEPDLLFLDEPSAGLDPVSAAELDALILTLNRTLGLTVIVVTHELESIFAIASRCIVLDKEAKGIIAQGEPKKLREDKSDKRVYSFFNRLPREAA